MGWTPLMIAASIKDGEKLVEFLLSKGADPNEKSEQQQAPLSLACTCEVPFQRDALS